MILMRSWPLADSCGAFINSIRKDYTGGHKMLMLVIVEEVVLNLYYPSLYPLHLYLMIIKITIKIAKTSNDISFITKRVCGVGVGGGKEPTFNKEKNSASKVP